MMRPGCRFSPGGVLLGLALLGCAATLQPGQVAAGRDGSHRYAGTEPVQASWPLPPDPVDGPEPFDAPAVYRKWFAQVLECTGLSSALNEDSTANGSILRQLGREFDDVKWFLVDSLPGVGARRSGAGQFIPPDTILVPWRLQGVQWLVMHELVHFVTGVEGHGPEEPAGTLFLNCGVTDESIWREHQKAEGMRKGREVPGLLRGSGGNGAPASPAGS